MTAEETTHRGPVRSEDPWALSHDSRCLQPGAQAPCKASCTPSFAPLCAHLPQPLCFTTCPPGQPRAGSPRNPLELLFWGTPWHCHLTPLWTKVGPPSQPEPLGPRTLRCGPWGNRESPSGGQEKPRSWCPAAPVRPTQHTGLLAGSAGLSLRLWCPQPLAGPWGSCWEARGSGKPAGVPGRRWSRPHRACSQTLPPRDGLLAEAPGRTLGQAPPRARGAQCSALPARRGRAGGRCLITAGWGH